MVNPKHIFFHYQLVTCTLIFRQLARALARADACGRWSPYSSFPSFVSLSPCPSFLSSPCQLSSLSLLINPPYPLPPLGSSIFASNNSSPPHPPPPRLSFSTSLESSQTPLSLLSPKNLSSDPLPSNIRPSWPSSPSKMVGSGGHEVPGLIHLKFSIIIIPELFQGIIGRLLNTSSYNHCTGNPPHALSFCPESHKCRCEFSLKNKRYPYGKSFGVALVSSLLK